MKRASIADVAHRAGVSTATVSRVTTDPEKVSEKTRNKVLAAIEELHFVKSATGLSLKEQRSKTILVVVPNIGNIYYSEIFAGIHLRAEANGYDVMITTPSSRTGQDSILKRLRTGRVDGVIILEGYDVSEKQNEVLNRLYQGVPPVVGFAEGPGLMDIPHIYIDNKAAAIRATNHLLASGHQRIVHIRGHVDKPVGDLRCEGFIAAMNAAGLEVKPEDIFESEFHRDGGRRAARRISRLAHLPTAVFCCTDEVAMGCISEFATLGIEVPGEISVMGFDNNPFADVYVPPLTTMAQPREQIGVSALDLLLRIIKGNDPDMQLNVELDVHLAKRASVATIHRAE